MSQEKILVVDDDKDIVNTLKIQLEKEGYHVYCAHNGLEALQVLESTQIHLMLLDVMMPHMDGFSTILKIRERNNIPILIMSAKSEDLLHRLKCRFIYCFCFLPTFFGTNRGSKK